MSRFSAGGMQTATIDGVTTAAAVIAAPGEGRKIIVIGGALSMATAGTITLDTTEANSEIIDAMPLGAGVPLLLNVADHAHFEVGENLALRLTATQACSGYLRYVITRA
jgi:hypothetical protein